MREGPHDHDNCEEHPESEHDFSPDEEDSGDGASQKPVGRAPVPDRGPQDEVLVLQPTGMQAQTIPTKVLILKLTQLL